MMVKRIIDILEVADRKVIECGNSHSSRQPMFLAYAEEERKTFMITYTSFSPHIAYSLAFFSWVFSPVVQCKERKLDWGKVRGLYTQACTDIAR